MKKLSLLLCLTLSFYSKAQIHRELISEYKKRLDSVDLKSIRSGYFLNRGFLFDEQIQEQRKIKPGTENNYVLFNSKRYEMLLRGLSKASTNANTYYLDFELVKAKNKNDISHVNIAVIHVMGEWLSEQEISDNIALKRMGHASSKIYDRIPIYSSTVLNKKVYSGKVQFEFPSELYHIEGNGILRIEADFGDGQGFKEIISGNKHLVSYQGVGGKLITIKFYTLSGEVITQSVLNVVTMEETIPDHIFEIGPEHKSGRTEALSGGKGELFNGCDGGIR